MYRFRPFRNSDPPALVDIWRTQSPTRGVLHPMSVMIFEHFVLSKPYFDRQGLIVAERDAGPVGFIHAGFGPNEAFTDVSHETGVISMMQWRPEESEMQLRQGLVGAAEAYLAERGAKSIVAGPYPPFNPFYHGLTGLSESAGVLAEDHEFHETLVSLEYLPADRFVLMECDLGSLPPIIDRRQRQLTRTHEVQAQLDHEFSRWWDTCAYGPIQRSEFRVIAKIGLEPCGSMLWWNVDLEGTGLRPPTASIARVSVPEQHRRSGLATFLVNHALRQLKSSGTAKVLLQISQENATGTAFFQKLGFESVNRGISYRKSLQAS